MGSSSESDDSTCLFDICFTSQPIVISTEAVVQINAINAFLLVDVISLEEGWNIK
jgi:hypothetical protein